MTITLNITGISNLGQGFGFLPGEKNKIFISKTIPGDFVKANITKKNSKFTAANLIEIITPSQDRKKALCQYFRACGGCSLQHLENNFYQNYKQKNLIDLIRNLNFDKNINWIWIKENSRRRVNFHVNENNEIGFYKESSNDLVKISECLMLENELSKLIPNLQNLLNNLPKNSVAEIFASLADNGVDMVFNLNKSNLEINNQLINFAEINKIIRLNSKNSEHQKLLFLSEIPQLTYGEIKIELPPEIFLQASRSGQKAIVEEIINFVKSKPEIKSVADLYCGIGTYSFALPQPISVTGFEGDEIMVKNINKNSAKNNLQNFIRAEKKDLALNPLNISELKNYDLVLINPPRNGAKSQAAVLAKSNVKYIIMISCNPHSFIIDAEILINSGYKITKLTAIDQFYYTHHLEVVAIFER